MITQLMCTLGGGPLSYSYETDSFTNVPFESYFEFADVVLADLPSGTGFSVGNDAGASMEDAMGSLLGFFLELAEVDREMDLKNREIIFYGISYGAALWAYVGKELMDRGYKVKGFLLDSPWIDPKVTVQKFERIMEEYKVCSGEKLEFWAKQSDLCLEAMNAPAEEFTCEIGKKCDDLFNSVGPYADANGNFVANGYDLDPNVKTNVWYYLLSAGVNNNSFWNSERAKEIFGSDHIPLIMNTEVYREWQVCRFNWSWLPYLEEIFKTGAKIHILNGHYDGICNPMIVTEWLKTLHGFAENWDKADWELTRYGKRKGFWNFSYDLVENAGHMVGMVVPQLSVQVIREIMAGL
jgi:pimeloyl-ACP methyl ester carboxylesterase